MSGTDVVDLGTLGSCYVSEESAFCTPGTERRCYPISDSIEVELTQAEIDVKNLRTAPFDALDPVKGFKGGTVKMGFYIQPPPTVLTTGATVDDDAACPFAVVARCIFGGESAFAGTTVLAASGAVGGFTTATGHGSRFPAGQLCLVTDPAPGTGLIPARVLSRASDVITFYPSASGALADDSPVINLRTFYPSNTNAKTLSVAVCAAQDPTHQARLLGCTGSMEIKMEREGLAQIMVDLQAASWVDWGALGLSIADAADPMMAPLSCRNAVLYFQSTATTTRANYPVDSFNAKLNFGNKHINTLTGGTEGKRSAARIDGLTDAFAEITLTFSLDHVPDATWWAARTKLTCMLWFQYDDANNARRSIVVDLAKAMVVGKPKHAKGSDGLIKTTVTLRAKRDTSTTGTTALATAPFRLGTG